MDSVKMEGVKNSTENLTLLSRLLLLGASGNTDENASVVRSYGLRQLGEVWVLRPLTT